MEEIMKKLTALLLILTLLMPAAMLTAFAEAPAFEMNTSMETPVFHIGQVDKTLFEGPFLVTSFGQSADAAMLEALMKRAKVTDYTFDSLATVEKLEGVKTVIIAVGASTKGLGSAGISEADETARAEAMVEAIKEKELAVIMCHLGGGTRRGALSDKYTAMVLELASYALVVEDANFDGMFTKYAEEHGLPLTFIYAIANGVAVFTELFAK